MSELELSLDNTQELRQIIIDNPDLPLLIFAGDEAYTGEYTYNMAFVKSFAIEEFCFADDIYYIKKDYRDKIDKEYSDKFFNNPDCEFAAMSTDEFEKAIDKKVAEAKFVKAIVVYVG